MFSDTFRRREQKTISDIRTNGTQHPLVNQQEKDALGTARTTSDHLDKQKNSDQSHDVFVDEAYDL